MFDFVEKKLNTSIVSFFTLGLICLVLGVLVIMYDALLRAMVGLLFFILAYISLHFAWKLQFLKGMVSKKFSLGKSSRKKSK